MQLLCWSQRVLVVLLLCSHCGGITYRSMLKNGLTTQLISEMPVPALCPGHVFPATPFCQGRLPCSWKSTWTRKSLSVGFVTYYKVIIGSSLSLGRAVGRLLALKSFWCREQKIKQEWAETWVARGCTGLDIQPTLPGWFVRVQNLHGSQFPFPTSCFFWSKSMPRRRQSVQVTWQCL